MKKSKIETRVRAILDNRVRRTVTRNEKIVAITLATAVLCPLAVVHAAGVKPFADLPKNGDPTVSVAVQSDTSQTPAEKRAAAARAHHLRVLANQLLARQREFMVAQTHVAKLRANIQELSRKLGMVPQDDLAPKNRLEWQLRAAIDQLRHAQSALRTVQPPPVTPFGALPAPRFREIPQGVLPPAIQYPNRPPFAPPPAMGPRPGGLAGPPQAPANPFMAPPAALAARLGGLAGPPQSPGNPFMTPPPAPGASPRGLAGVAPAPASAFFAPLASLGTMAGGLVPVPRNPIGPQVDPASTFLQSAAVQSLSDAKKQLAILEVQLARLEALKAATSRQSELDKLKTEEAALQTQIAVLESTNAISEAQSRIAQARAQEANADLAALLARRAGQLKLYDDRRQSLNEWLDVYKGQSRSTESMKQNFNIPAGTPLTLIYTMGSTASMKQRLNALQSKLTSGKLKGESLRRIKLESERLTLLLRLKQIEADLNKK